MNIKIVKQKKLAIGFLLAGVLAIFPLYLKTINLLIKDPTYIDKIKSSWQGAEYMGSDGVIRQNKKNNCGPTALKMILDKLNVKSTVKELELLSGMTQYGTNLEGLMNCINIKGFRAEAWRLSFEDLKNLEHLAIAFISNNHYVVVDSITKDGGVIILDPAIGRLKLEENNFTKIWKGITLIIN